MGVPVHLLEGPQGTEETDEDNMGRGEWCSGREGGGTAVDLERTPSLPGATNESLPQGDLSFLFKTP